MNFFVANEDGPNDSKEVFTKYHFDNRKRSCTLAAVVKKSTDNAIDTLLMVGNKMEKIIKSTTEGTLTKENEQPIDVYFVLYEITINRNRMI